MGNKNSSPSADDSNNNVTNTSNVVHQTQHIDEEEFKDLIENAQRTSPNPVGSAERQLLMALETFALLENPEMFTSNTQKKKNNNNNNNNNNNALFSSSTFSETFKWSVLSMLRSCGTCEKKYTKHCPLQRQALILPPFKLPSASSLGSSPRLDHPLHETIQDVIEEPALRFICDDCLNLIHINRREALQAEVKKVAERTRGFAGGTMNIDVVDGPSVCGRNFCEEQEQEPTKGLSKIQNNLVLMNHKHENDDELCVNGLSLTGYYMSDKTVCMILRNPDLKRMQINFPSNNRAVPGLVTNNSSSSTVPVKNSLSALISDRSLGDFSKELVNNPEKYPGLQSIEELTLSGYGSAGINASEENADRFPLFLCSNLQSLTVSGFKLSRTDLTRVLDGLMTRTRIVNHQEQDDQSKIRKPGCQLLQNVILVNQSELKLDDVLDTLGQLPLHQLSVANMNVKTPIPSSPVDETSAHDNIDNNKNDDFEQRSKKQVAALSKPPILVSQLVMWGSDADSFWMANNLLPRTQLMTMIDISSTKTCIFHFLDACAASNLSLLRVVRANNCTVPSSTTSSTNSNSSSNSSSLHINGVRHEVSSWENLFSLSTLQLLKFTVKNELLFDQELRSSLSTEILSSMNKEKRKFSTLPSLTSLNISLTDDRYQDFFVSEAVLGSLKTLQSLYFHSSSRSAHYGARAPVPGRTMFGNNNSSSTSGSSSSSCGGLSLPSLQKLHIHNFPPFHFSFNGAPQLLEVSFGGNQHESLLRDFMQQGGLGKNVTELNFSSQPGASSSMSLQLPLGSFPRLKSLSVLDKDYLSSFTIAALESCSSLTKLKINLGDSLSSRPGGGGGASQKVDLCQALSGMKNLVELDLSHGGYLMDNFSGKDSNGEFIIFPCLKKFWKREDASSSTRQASIKESQSTIKNTLLLFLSKQPVLEEIDIENHPVDPMQLHEFWTSECMRNSVTYLNIAGKHNPFQFSDGVRLIKIDSSAAPSPPSKLKILKWKSEWSSFEVCQMILAVESLRFLEIQDMNCMPPDEEEEAEEKQRKGTLSLKRRWPYKEFVQVLTERGVQLSNGSGHSFMVNPNAFLKKK